RLSRFHPLKTGREILLYFFHTDTRHAVILPRNVSLGWLNDWQSLYLFASIGASAERREHLKAHHIDETSELRPEAGFRLERRVAAVTGLDALHPGVAVGQPRQVFVPIARQRDGPRQADIKVWIEGPQPVAPHFVVDALANVPAAL